MGSSASSKEDQNKVNMCKIQNLQAQVEDIVKINKIQSNQLALKVIQKSNIQAVSQEMTKKYTQPKSMRQLQKKKPMQKQKTQFKLKKTRQNNQNDIVTGLDQIQEMIIQRKKQLNPVKKSSISDRKVLMNQSKTDGLVPLIPLRQLSCNLQSQTRTKRFRVSKLL